MGMGLEVANTGLEVAGTGPEVVAGIGLGLADMDHRESVPKYLFVWSGPKGFVGELTRIQGCRN